MLLKAFRFWGNGYEIQCGPIYWDFYFFFPLPTQPSPGSQILPKRGNFFINNLKKN
jgi:hypothetical protein